MTCGADFWSEQRRPRILRNEKAVKPLKNKQFNEIADSAIIMTSMTYDLRCETLRFAWRNDPLVFGGFALRSDGKAKRTWIRLVKGSRASGAREAWRRWRPLGAFWTLLRDATRGIAPQDEAFGVASAAFPSASYGQAFQADARRLRTKSLGVPLKATKSCAKAQLSDWNRWRAQTCARPAFARFYDWSKLALGPASASALPTSSPRSSIEVCSRTERSSPFACRSACSGERATLTVTFNSTSGCR